MKGGRDGDINDGGDVGKWLSLLCISAVRRKADHRGACPRPFFFSEDRKLHVHT